MSLNYDLSRIDRKFWHADEADETEKVVTESMIWATIAVDMGEITEANAEEFARRLNSYQELRGAFMQRYVDGEMQERPLTLEDVRNRVGLKTNVTTTSKRAFTAKLARLARETANS